MDDDSALENMILIRKVESVFCQFDLQWERMDEINLEVLRQKRREEVRGRWQI